MTGPEVLDVARDAITTLVLVASPLMLVGLAEASFALYQYLTETRQVWLFTRPEVYGHRGSGTYMCPNHLAGFLEMLLPLGLAYSVMSRSASLCLKRPNCMSTMARICSRPSEWNTTISSTRLMNSGRKCWLTTSITAAFILS